MEDTRAPASPFKVCPRCKEAIAATRAYFSPDISGRYGLYSVCKRCVRERKRVYQRTHREHINALREARRIPPELLPETKMCTKCRKVFPLDMLNFHRHSASPDGYDPRCRPCINSRERRAYAKKPRKVSFVRRVRVSPLLPLKYCRWCDTVHARTETFFSRSRHYRDGLGYVCKGCRKRAYEQRRGMRR